MRLSDAEVNYLTALAREQAQTGCRGPAHELLRQHAYPGAPRVGERSLAFSYEAVPLIGLLLRDYRDLQSLDDFLRKGELDASPAWPWNSVEEYRARLEAARHAKNPESADAGHPNPRLSTV